MSATRVSPAEIAVWAVSGSAPLSEARAPRACAPTAPAWSARSDRSASMASSLGFTSASPLIVSSGRPSVPGAWSRPVAIPAAPRAMTTTTASQTRLPRIVRAARISGSVSRRRSVSPGSRRGANARQLLGGLAPQVAERALHRSRLETEPIRDHVERADVVELQLPQLVGRDRERQVDELRGAGDEPDERDRHRDDDPPLPEGTKDLAGDLAVGPVARAPEIERPADGRRVLERPDDDRGHVVGVDRLETRAAPTRDGDETR